MILWSLSDSVLGDLTRLKSVPTAFEQEAVLPWMTQLKILLYEKPYLSGAMGWMMAWQQTIYGGAINDLWRNNRRSLMGQASSELFKRCPLLPPVGQTSVCTPVQIYLSRYLSTLLSSSPLRSSSPLLIIIDYDCPDNQSWSMMMKPRWCLFFLSPWQPYRALRIWGCCCIWPLDGTVMLRGGVMFPSFTFQCVCWGG